MSKGKQLRAAHEAAAEQSAQWWQYARHSAQLARAGHLPPRIAVQGIVLGHNEHPLLEATAHYARLYGGDGTYYRTSTFAFGSPGFVVGALAASAIGNNARKRAAEQSSQVTWREHQQVPVLVTDQRVLCRTPTRGWLSFWFSGVSEFYPDLHNWAVTLVFTDGVPLQLTGPSTPALSLWFARGILGPSWTEDPRLAALFS